MTRALLAAALLLAAGCSKGTPPSGEAPVSPFARKEFQPVESAAAYASPFMGSGGFGYAFGSAFPGALAPHGLCKVGPDTRGQYGVTRFLHYAGYWYGDDFVQGFSHLHLHGTGASDYGVLSVMPVPTFDASKTTADGYESHFDKKSESASPGSYAVTLDNGPVKVELTARTHSAHHRYTFAKDAPTATILFDLDHHLDSGKVESAEVTLFPAERRIRGKLRSIGEMSGGFGGYEVYFEAKTKQAWSSSRVWTFAAPLAEGTTLKGEKAGFALTFDKPGEPLELQLAISLVSAEGAAANLAAELKAFDFDATRAATAADWEALLSRARLSGGTDDARKLFYSALYHAFLMPTVMNDVDHRFLARDGAIRTAEGFRYLSDMSLWDTYRTTHPLYTVIAPETALDAVRSLDEMARPGSAFPRWPIATGESGTMIGAPADVVISEAYLKGIRGFDAPAVYTRLRAAALDELAPAGGRGSRGGSEAYMKLGFVPASRGGSVSVTAEYAGDDMALGGFAKALGKDSDAATLTARSLGYRKLFDAPTGFLRGKNEDGSLAPGDTDPILWTKEFVEANAWQTAFAAYWDVDGMIALYGGQEPFLAKLTALFEKGKAELDGIKPDDQITRALPRPFYWQGNEPDIHAAYLFALAGRPDLTQRWVRWAMKSFYSARPEGLVGNDDGGTLSAWWVFSALGFYPLAGTDRYVVGTPYFPKVELAVSGGTFTVEAPEVSEENLYVQSVKLNGVALEKPELRHAELKAGGSLVFVMGAAPSKWGVR